MMQQLLCGSLQQMFYASSCCYAMGQGRVILRAVRNV